jgi:hypothetical protein
MRRTAASAIHIFHRKGWKIKHGSGTLCVRLWE